MFLTTGNFLFFPPLGWAGGKRFASQIKAIFNKYFFSHLSPFMLLAMGSLIAKNSDAGPTDKVVVSFAGSVIECICKMPEEMNRTMTVKLPTVSAKSFAVNGERAGYQKFSLRLIECPRRRNIYLRFSGPWGEGSPALAALNNGNKGAGMARGLALGFQQKDGTQLRFGDDSLQVMTDDEGNVVFELEAFYERVSAPVVAGVANATIDFTILYN